MIDNLTFGYNGNRRTKVTDAITEQLTYEGCFDFVDGTNTGNDYTYNANGALIKDLNKDITKIEYDLLGNPKKVTMSDSRSIEYVYSADGRRLRAVHKSGSLSEKTDYIGSLILKNGKRQMYRFSGGYASFDADTINGCHYYIADYQGNNRMVVNASTDEVEQVNHYYAYGGIIGDLSSNEGLQEFKFGDKKLDRTYGLDLYDFEARQYDAITPWFTSIDPLAEKYYSISPYVYCAGDPVNLIDPTGEDVYNVLTFYINGVQTVYIFRQETDDKYDMVYVDGDNQGLKLTDQNIMKGLWASQSTITAKDLKKNSQRCSTIWTSSKNENEVMSLFYYLADNSNVEWSASKYKDGTLAIGGFSLHHNKQGVKGSAPARYNQVQTIDNEIAHIHSHPESEDSSFQDRESYSNNRRLTDKIKQNKGDFSVTTVNDVSSQYLYKKKSGKVFFFNREGAKGSLININKFRLRHVKNE